MTTHATLSLCMIVRDEAELLPRFIEAVDGLWDEWIVVDTGSLDETKALVEAAGARVFDHPWTGDFAAARNAALAHAQSDWILVLDADEFVSEAGAAEIRRVIRDQEVGAATLPMRNPLPYGNVRVTPLLRLFRNAPNIWFEYPIHEDVTDSVLTMLRQSGRRMAALREEVEHVGYIHDRAVAKDKRARDQAILERCLGDDAGDAYSWFKLLSLARFWNDRPLELETANAIEAELRERGAEWLEGKHFAGELLAMVGLVLHQQRPRIAAAFFDEWMPVAPHSCELHLRRGEMREQAGDVEGAIGDFERCLATDARTQNQQMATVRPRLGLARVAMARGRLDEAFAFTEAALADNPVDPEALLSAAFLWQARSAVPSWDGFLAWFTERFEPSKMLYLTIAERCVDAGQTRAARRYIDAAGGAADDLRAQTIEARCLLIDGRVAACRVACEALVGRDARAGLGVLVCDLIEGRASSLRLDLDVQSAHAAMRLWVDTLRACSKPQLVDDFRAYAGAVKQVFPWLPAALAA